MTKKHRKFEWDRSTGTRGDVFSVYMAYYIPNEDIASKIKKIEPAN